MTALGAFRDDYYNAQAALTAAQTTAISAATPVLVTAAQIAGAVVTKLVASGQTTAQAWTTDTAVNIIARLQSVVATAYAASLAGFGAGVNPSPGVPNLFNLTYTLEIWNTNASAGTVTLTAGAGVTISGSAVVTFSTLVEYVVTITSPTTITLTRVASATAAA